MNVHCLLTPHYNSRATALVSQLLCMGMVSFLERTTPLTETHSLNTLNVRVVDARSVP